MNLLAISRNPNEFINFKPTAELKKVSAEFEKKVDPEPLKNLKIFSPKPITQAGGMPDALSVGSSALTVTASLVNPALISLEPIVGIMSLAIGYYCYSTMWGEGVEMANLLNVDPPRRFSTVADLQEQMTKNTSKRMLAQAAKAVERNAGEINRRCSDGREIPDALDDNWSRYLRGLGRSAATK